MESVNSRESTLVKVSVLYTGRATVIKKPAGDDEPDQPDHAMHKALTGGGSTIKRSIPVHVVG